MVSSYAGRGLQSFGATMYVFTLVIVLGVFNQLDIIRFAVKIQVATLALIVIDFADAIV